MNSKFITSKHLLYQYIFNILSSYERFFILNAQIEMRHSVLRAPPYTLCCQCKYWYWKWMYKKASYSTVFCWNQHQCYGRFCWTSMCIESTALVNFTCIKKHAIYHLNFQFYPGFKADCGWPYHSDLCSCVSLPKLFIKSILTPKSLNSFHSKKHIHTLVGP